MGEAKAIVDRLTTVLLSDELKKAVADGFQINAVKADDRHASIELSRQVTEYKCLELEKGKVQISDLPF